MPKHVDWGAEAVHVWGTLFRIQGDDRVPRADLADACERTPARISQTIAYIRDAVPEAPLVSSREGYRITSDPGENEDYRHLVASYTLTRFRRWRTGAGEPFFRQVEAANPAQAEWLRQQAAQMEASLELALNTRLDGQS